MYVIGKEYFLVNADSIVRYLSDNDDRFYKDIINYEIDFDGSPVNNIITFLDFNYDTVNKFIKIHRININEFFDSSMVTTFQSFGTFKFLFKYWGKEFTRFLKWLDEKDYYYGHLHYPVKEWYMIDETIYNIVILMDKPAFNIGNNYFFGTEHIGFDLDKIEIKLIAMGLWDGGLDNGN